MLNVREILIDYFQIDWTSFTYSMATSAKANVQKIACKKIAIFLFVLQSSLNRSSDFHKIWHTNSKSIGDYNGLCFNFMGFHLNTLIKKIKKSKFLLKTFY